MPKIKILARNLSFLNNIYLFLYNVKICDLSLSILNLRILEYVRAASSSACFLLRYAITVAIYRVPKTHMSHSRQK